MVIVLESLSLIQICGNMNIITIICLILFLLCLVIPMNKMCIRDRYNLAYKADVTVSGCEVSDGRFTGPMAVDGIISATSRWSGAKTNEQWMLVDLGKIVEASEIIIHFESECPDYEVQISQDGKNFTTIYSDSNASQGDTVSKQISFDKQEIRYVKYVQHKMWNHSNGKQYSTSIYELEVYKEFNICLLYTSSVHFGPLS